MDTSPVLQRREINDRPNKRLKTQGYNKTFRVTGEISSASCDPPPHSLVNIKTGAGRSQQANSGILGGQVEAKPRRSQRIAALPRKNYRI